MSETSSLTPRPEESMPDEAVAQPETVRPRPRIYAGSWLDRERGLSHGTWVDATQDDAAIGSQVLAMLARSPTARRNGVRAVSWGIFDWANFGDLDLSRVGSTSWVGALGRGIAEHGSPFAAYAKDVQHPAALAEFENDYLGSWASLDDYAASFTSDPGYNRLLDEHLPGSVRGYVRLDTAAIARDMAAEHSVRLVPLPTGDFAVFATR